MDFDKLSILASTLVAVFMAYMYWREYRLKQVKTPYENNFQISAAINNLSTALGLQSNELVESLTDAAKLRAELEQERETTRKYREETAIHRQDTDNKIEALNREYAKEIADLRRQIEEGNERYNRLKSYTEELVKIFQDDRIIKVLSEFGISLPEIHNLSDTLKGFKLKGKQ